MSDLLPEGIEGLADAPYTLHTAICSALRILEYEELPTDERPPRRIWMDGERLTAHWKEVEHKRKEKYGTSSDEDEDDYEENAVELITRG